MFPTNKESLLFIADIKNPCATPLEALQYIVHLQKKIMGEFSYCYINFIFSNIQQYVLVDVTSFVSKATRGENQEKNNKTPVSY